MTKIEMKGALAERIAALKRDMPEPMEETVHFLSAQYGKDALMSVLLKMLVLEDRGTTEMLAEAAFDLVPGQVRRTRHTAGTSVEIPKEPDRNWTWGGEEDDDPTYPPLAYTHIELRRWRAEITFGFDYETGTLAVRDI